MLRVLPDFERFLKVHNLHNAAVPLVTLAGDPVVHLVPIPVIETRNSTPPKRLHLRREAFVE